MHQEKQKEEKKKKKKKHKKSSNSDSEGEERKKQEKLKKVSFILEQLLFVSVTEKLGSVEICHLIFMSFHHGSCNTMHYFPLLLTLS